MEEDGRREHARMKSDSMPAFDDRKAPIKEAKKKYRGHHSDMPGMTMVSGQGPTLLDKVKAGDSDVHRRKGPTGLSSTLAIEVAK